MHSVSGFWVPGLIYIVKNRYSYGFCLSLPYEELCLRDFAVCLTHTRIHSQYVLINSQKNTEHFYAGKKTFPEQKEVRRVLLVLCLCKICMACWVEGNSFSCLPLFCGPCIACHVVSGQPHCSAKGHRREQTESAYCY